MNLKICDLCNGCVYSNEYEIRNGEIICILCIEEEAEENEKKNEIPNRPVGNLRSTSR
jgi:recombinational DNA repair protein (RecF pathway)